MRKGKNVEAGRRKGMAILNGNVKGDKTEEFTYVEKRGATVIDYVITNNTGLDMIEKFYVEDIG